MSDIVKLYNPANSSALSLAQIEGLKTLNNDQIRELAQAYPNLTMARAYLLIIDTKKKNPLPQLSTFENLYNLRVKNSQLHYVAYGFKGVYKTTSVTKTKRQEFLDLSDEELLSLPGFKTAQATGVNGSELKSTDIPAHEVKVTHINKVVNDPIDIKSADDKFIIENPTSAQAKRKYVRKVSQ